jgi:polysaccharide export outer membrane protein
MRKPGPLRRRVSALATVVSLYFVAFLLAPAFAATPQAPALAAAQQQAPAAGGASPEYQLQPGDTVEVAVWKEPELTKTLVVRPDGKFSFPLAGEVNATGRSVSQVQKDIEGRLKQFIPEPVVTVSVSQIGGYRVYVIGQVIKPGAYIMNPQLNVMQALSLAGGTTPFASLNNIIVMRNGGPAGGQQRVLQFRYEDVAKGRNLAQNVMLEAGDVVIVP